jgi:broad specificity phosphatase PhoE
VSSLVLIRHGQASWASVNYDVLSSLGEIQATLLGRWLARHKVKVDALYTGPHLRQRDTARHLCEGARTGGGACPDPEILPGLAEHPTQDIVTSRIDSLKEEDPALLAELFADAEEKTWRDPRTFRRLFVHAMTRWRNGADVGRAETFAAFQSRVYGALDEIMAAQGRGKRVLVVTSAGPIALAMRRVLGIGDEVMFRLNLSVANSSQTELRWREDELSLLSFNALPHLPAEHTTYR